MYKLIGGDGKEYGPVSQDQIRQWLAEGRLNAESKIRPEGTEDWKALGEVPELKGLLTPFATPPRLSASPPANARTSKMAIASVVFAVLGLPTLGATALLGLVFGIIALVQIGRSRNQLRGFGAALTGTVLSTAFLLVLPLFAAMLLPALARAKSKAQAINCMNNIRQVCLAGFMYADDHKTYPATTNWCDAVKPFLPGTGPWRCPAGEAGLQCHYAFNAKLAGLEPNEIKVPARTVTFFECDGEGWNRAGGSELLPRRARHSNAVIVAFADGHSEAVPMQRLSQLNWDPAKAEP